MPQIGTRVRVPWEMGTRDGVVTNQIGAETRKPRIRMRPDGETAEAEFPLDQIDLVTDDDQ